MKHERIFLNENDPRVYIDTYVANVNTVRDAIGDLPDPLDVEASCAIHNHEYRKGAKIYAGHSGSKLDEPSKTIKAGSHGVPGGENMIILE